MATQEQENYYVDKGLTPLQPDPIQKLKLQANIVLGDFIFNTIDEYGVVWVISDIEGWWQHPEPEMPDIPRGFGDGSYDVQGRYLARNFVIKGSFITQNPALVELSRDTLVSATDLVYKGVWLKTGSNPIRATFVRLNGEISINTTNSRGRTDFSIGLRAADPIKYSWNDQEPDGYEIVELPARNLTQGYTGSVNVTNIGNYPVPCYLEVVGTLVSPATIFNRTTEQLIILTQGLKGSSSASVVNKQLSFDVDQLKDVATLTTTSQHGFRQGDIVFVSNVGTEFDGERLITSVPTSTTFTFDADAAEVQEVAFKKLLNGVATLQTVEEHGFSPGDSITVSGVDSVFDGNYTVDSAPTVNTLTFSKTRVPPRTIISKVLVSNIATLTTSEAHNFILGESVTVSGVDTNFDGTYEIIAIPSSTQFSYAATRTNARGIINKEMSNDIVTLTTSGPHGFVQDEGVNVSGVDLSLNGGYFIDSLTSTTFSYRRTRATEKSVSIRARSGNVATITTSAAHNFVVGEQVTVSGVGSGFDGTHTITTLPSNTTFTYANNGSALVSASVSNATVFSKSRVIKSYQVTGNVVTITTNSAHGAIFGEEVIITGTGDVDGTYEVTAIPSSNTLQYAKTMSNVASTEPTGAFIEMSGTIQSDAVIPDGTATVAGSLPSSAATGTAGVSEDVSRTEAFGSVIKKNNVQFTPGLSGNALLSPEILEIDTKNREVAFNGEVVGARGRIDVLADFIQLAPGENIIEFQDEGAPEGEANLRIFYRSGWLA